MAETSVVSFSHELTEAREVARPGEEEEEEEEEEEVEKAGTSSSRRKRKRKCSQPRRIQNFLDDDEADDNEDCLFPEDDETVLIDVAKIESRLRADSSDDILHLILPPHDENREGAQPKAKRKKHTEESSSVGFSCPMCEWVAWDQTGLNMHIRSRHTSRRVHRDSTPKAPSEMTTTPAGKKEETFPCPSCGKNYSTKNGLRFHIANYHGEVDRTSNGYPCKCCSEAFSTINEWEEHQRQSHKAENPVWSGEPSLVFLCMSCPKQFSSVGSVTAHQAHQHRKSRSEMKGRKLSFTIAQFTEELKEKEEVKCPVGECEAVFHTAKSVYLHALSCKGHGKRREAIVCETCSRKFGSMAGLKYHQRTAHVDEQESVDTTPKPDSEGNATPSGRREAKLKARLFVQTLISGSGQTTDTPQQTSAEQASADRTEYLELRKKWQEGFRQNGFVGCVYSGCTAQMKSVSGAAYHYNHCRYRHLSPDDDKLAKAIVPESSETPEPSSETPGPSSETPGPSSANVSLLDSSAADVATEESALIDESAVDLSTTSPTTTPTVKRESPNPEMVALRSEWRKELAKKKVLVCQTPGCSTTVKTVSGMAYHYKHCTGGKMKYICEKCGANYARRRDLDRHEKDHLEGNVFACEECNQLFVNRTLLDQHMSNEHNIVKTYACEQCQENFKNWEDYNNHNSKHSTEAVKAAKEEAPMDPERAAYVEQLAQWRHELKEKGHISCPKDGCSVELHSVTAIKYHVKTCTGSEECVCEICGKTFTSAGRLSVHKKRHERENATDLTGTPGGEQAKKGKPKSRKPVSEQRKKALGEEVKQHLDSWREQLRNSGEIACPRPGCNGKFYAIVSISAHFRNCRAVLPENSPAGGLAPASESLSVYVCDICGKKYASHAGYTYHKEVHKRQEAPAATAAPSESSSEIHGRRAAAQKAMQRFLQNGIEEENDYLSESSLTGDFTSAEIDAFTKQLDTSGKITCPGKNCEAEFMCIQLLLQHVKTHHRGCLRVVKKDGEADSTFELETSAERKRVARSYYKKGIPRFLPWPASHQAEAVLRRLPEPDTELYALWLPLVSHWKHLPEREAYAYLPKDKESPAFCVSTAEMCNGQRLDRLEACAQADHAMVNTSGSVFSIEWCPTPASHPSAEQVLAVTSKLSSELMLLNKTYEGKGLIQLWSFGAMDSNTLACTPHMSLGIAHDEGYAWQMQWCPVGAWQPCKALPKRTEKLPRLGLLAVAFSSGKVMMFSVPHPSSLAAGKKLPVFQASQCMKLSLCTNIEQPVSHGQALSLAWHPNFQCKQLAAGFSDGMVVCWNLKAEALWLWQQVDALDCLRPTSLLYQMPEQSARALSWCPTSPNHLVVGLPVGELLVWDLRSPSRPQHVLHSFGPTMSVAWLDFWQTILVAYDTTLCMENDILSFSWRAEQGCHREHIPAPSGSSSSISVNKVRGVVALATIEGEMCIYSLPPVDIDFKRPGIKSSLSISMDKKGGQSASTDSSTSGIEEAGGSSSPQTLPCVALTEAEQNGNDTEAAPSVGGKWDPFALDDAVMLNFHKPKGVKVCKRGSGILPTDPTRSLAGGIFVVRWNPNKAACAWLAMATGSGLVFVEHQTLQDSE